MVLLRTACPSCSSLANDSASTIWTTSSVCGDFASTATRLTNYMTFFQMPPRFTGPCRTSWSSLEGLLVLLRRLSYPARLGDLCEEFGRSKPVLSLIFNTMLQWVWERYSGTLMDPFTRPYFTQERITRYTEAVARKVGVQLWVWAFLDGTVRRICRPNEDQREYYSGHKRYHCLKYQAVTTPDGLITCLHGPYEGRRHDAGIFQRSGLKGQLTEHMNRPGGGTYCLYGDSAYPLSLYLQKGYLGNQLDLNEQAFNTHMSSVRQAVEWSFDDMATLWAYLDMKRQQRVRLQPVALFYRVATLLTNCYICMRRGNRTSDYFHVLPPDIREYLA